jgi:hypothetical protein
LGGSPYPCFAISAESEPPYRRLSPASSPVRRLADIIDNFSNIAAHDPGCAPTFLAEKKQVLAEMVRWEGERLEVLPLFKEAAKLACAPKVDLASQKAASMPQEADPDQPK